MRDSIQCPTSAGVAPPAAIFSTIGTSTSGSASANGHPLAAKKRVVAETGTRDGERRIGQADVRQLGDTLRLDSEHLRRNTTVVAKLDVVDQVPCLGRIYLASRRSVSACFFIAARRSRRCSSGVPGNPDFNSRLAVEPSSGGDAA